MILDKFKLNGKSGIITGAGSGIGFGLATGLVQAGAELVIAARNLEKINAAAEKLQQHGGPVIPVKTDMASMDDIRALVDHTVDEFGKIDFLFNNAGIIRRNNSEDFLESDWDEMLNINLKGPFFLAQAVARVMISQNRKGKIINTTSLIAEQGGMRVPAYSASKGGLAQVTKTMANDWAKYNINVNAIGPGWVNTEMTQALREDKERFKGITSRIAMGRWAEPEELAGAAVYLASDASDYVTGQTIFVDGGWLSM